MKELTKKYLKEISSDKSFERGSEIFLIGDVTNFQIENGKVTAFVRGTRKYKVTISGKDDDFIFDCSCPYDYGGICKHCIAVGLEIIDRDIDFNLQYEIVVAKNCTSAKELIKNATRDKIILFLETIFREEPLLLKKFEVFVKGQLESESKVDFLGLRNEIIKQLESFDLVDYDRFYNHHQNYYRDEWDILYDGAMEELKNIMVPYFQKAVVSLKEKNIIDSFNYFMTIYEAICMFDDSGINDEVEIFESIKVELISLWTETFQQFELFLISNIPEEKVINRIFDIWLKSILTISEESFYDLFIFEKFFENIINTNEHTASIVLEIFEINQLMVIDTVKVQLYCYKILKDYDNWERVAIKYYQKDPKIADQLLDYYSGKNLIEEYLYIAQILFEENPGNFHDKIYHYLRDKQESLFFRKILFFHTLNTKKMKLVEEINERYGDGGVDELLSQIETHYNGKFYVRVLEYKKDFESILKYLQENIEYNEIEYAIKPIINIYPDQCYELIKNKTLQFLVIHKERKYYKIAVSWLRLLQKIKDEKIASLVNELFIYIRTKYKVRRALLDEMQELK